MKIIESTRKNVALEIRVYERVKEYGRAGESFSSCIDKVIDFAESKGMTREMLYKPHKERNV